MLFDCAVIGTGPAGLAAVLNLKAHHKSFVWIGAPALSDKIRKAEIIANYPGLPEISGTDMAKAFQKQIAMEGITIEDRMVTSVMPFSGNYALMAGADFYEAKTVILATGVAAAAVLPGETELLGRGVSYCATCDGNLYRGKRIAVISNSARFEPEVRFLAGLAQEVLLFPQYRDPNVSGENVRILYDRILSLEGQQRISALHTQKNGVISIDGIFCLRDSIALTTLLPGLAFETGHIAVNRSMETNLPGVFAAGDCTGRPYQYTKAVGEGNVASLTAISYLDQLENGKAGETVAAD